MEKLIYVHCLEDDRIFGFGAKTGLDALRKMHYQLGLNGKIGKFEDLLEFGHSKKTACITHNDKTYAVIL